MFSSSLDTPIGKLVIEAANESVNFIGFKNDTEENPNKLTELAKRQFAEYFSGTRSKFDFQHAQPGSAFQQKVWLQLTQIKPGEPISYAALSKQMNNPLAIRAIASANGKNNLMILVPCHRVIGSNGDLVGFSAGLWRKKWLLEHEANMMHIGQSVLTF